MPKAILVSFIDFSTNDYLNLSQSEVLFDAAKLSGARFGVGSTGSRLLSGNKKIFEDFEKRIAQDKGTESALNLQFRFSGQCNGSYKPTRSISAW